MLLKVISSITLKGIQIERNAFPASENIEENLDQFKYTNIHPCMDTEILLVFMTIYFFLNYFLPFNDAQTATIAKIHAFAL